MGSGSTWNASCQKMGTMKNHAVVGSSRHHPAALISWKQLAAFSGIQQSAAAVSGIFMRTQCSAAVSSSKQQ
jgi:hypothetical protein